MLQGSGDFQSLRLQLTAGLDQDGNETLSYSDDVVTLPKDHTTVTSDPRCAAHVPGTAAGVRQLAGRWVCLLMAAVHAAQAAA